MEEGRLLTDEERAEQYKFYVKFALDDIDNLKALEEIYKTIYRLRCQAGSSKQQ